MSRKSYDLEFRPPTFWEPYKKIIANIKGAERKKLANKAISFGRASEIPAWTLQEKLADPDRVALGQIHPRYMGGEYLPDFKREEVEIARVTLQSSTQDVISVRAKPAAHRIKYKIVDEYETPSTISPASSSRPLSMSRLICLMDGAKVGVYDGVSWSTGVVWGPLTMNLENSDDPLELIDFVEVTSEFYPELGDYYADEIQRFLQGRK